VKIIGIDPGKTVGLVLYDKDNACALDAYQVQAGDEQLPQVMDIVDSWIAQGASIVAIEWPRIYAKAGNDVADTIAQCGMLWWALGARSMPDAAPVWLKKRSVYGYAVYRSTVCALLSGHMGQLVRSDGGVWAALIDIHGGRGKADGRKVGPFACLTGKPHARAALAVAWTASQSMV
jgi:hypothetical protein